MSHTQQTRYAEKLTIDTRATCDRGKDAISACVIIHGQQDRVLTLHQQFIQLIGKIFTVILTQGGLAARINAAIAQRFHEIAHA
ncbi:hypothetical protein SAMN05421510_100370 [Nitrosomonas ureae]|uniref:Uncharacterized protein n=1 Tax=Nitrosomonas ureae TaxID=44577 RepID=A0A1H9AEM1_9PROT|nr:hypothetical protein SAMN05421510_100370 [Nitrosomonas ureae]